MNKKKILQFLEIAFLMLTIIGSLVFSFTSISIGIRNTSLNVKEGDILRLTIHAYEFNYTITGNVSLYDIVAGIHLYPFELESKQDSTTEETESSSEENETTYNDIDYPMHSNRDIQLFEGNLTTNLVITFEVLEKIDEDHAILQIKETGENFTLWLSETYRAHNPFTHPTMNIGLVIREKTNLTQSYVYWNPIYIFSSKTTREALNWMSRESENIANFDVLKLSKNQFLSPTGTTTSAGDNYQSNTTWTLFSNSNRIHSISSYYPTTDSWASAYANFTTTVAEDLVWSCSYSIELEWEYLKEGST